MAAKEFEQFQKLLSANQMRYFHKYEKAKSLYQEILDIDPDFLWCILAIADLTIEMKKYNEAVYWYTIAIGKTENKTHIYCQIGDCFLKQKDYTKAENNYNAGLKLYPDFVRAKRGLKISQVLKGELDFTKRFPLLLGK